MKFGVVTHLGMIRFQKVSHALPQEEIPSALEFLLGDPIPAPTLLDLPGVPKSSP